VASDGLAATARQRAVPAPRPAVLGALAVAGLAAASGSVALALASDHVAEPALQAALLDWITLPYIAGGLIAWWRRPQSRFGPLMVLAGFAIFASTLAWANQAVPYTIGQAFDLLPAVLFLHVFLAFPDGRLRRDFERALLAAGYMVAFGLELVGMALGGFGADNLLAVASEPELAGVLLQVQLIALSALALAGIAVLAARRRAASRPPRRAVALMFDAFALALMMIAVLFGLGAFDGPGFETVRRVTFATIGLAPVAFLVALLSARLARAAVGDLVVELRHEPAPGALRDALARALHDPTLTLAYWLPQFRSWVDDRGRAIAAPRAGRGRSLRLIDHGGEPVAAIAHDPGLDDEPELLDAVSAAAGIAVENDRLHAELQARLDELRGSRGRVIEAGQRERARLERNLHDGAQQRLVAVSLELSLLERQFAAVPGAGARLGHAQRQVAMSLEELRAIARGLHPAVVTGHGLGVALESLAAAGPVPVRLDVTVDDRLPEPVEVAAYYLVSECLANIGRHARASAAAIAVSRDGPQITVEVTDDGCGGADTESGSGLRGLADRVEAVGGQLLIWSPPGGGTRVRAELPCAR
jgi:signal transduction histidine kinase/nitrate reductase gamma subunit